MPKEIVLKQNKLEIKMKKWNSNLEIRTESRASDHILYYVERHLSEKDYFHHKRLSEEVVHDAD